MTWNVTTSIITETQKPYYCGAQLSIATLKRGNQIILTLLIVYTPHFTTQRVVTNANKYQFPYLKWQHCYLKAGICSVPPVARILSDRDIIGIVSRRRSEGVRGFWITFMYWKTVRSWSVCIQFHSVYNTTLLKWNRY